MKFKTWITTAIAGAALLAVGPVAAQEKLTVWWAKGFYKAEDDALFAAIKKFEAKNPKIKIDLSLFSSGSHSQGGRSAGRQQPAGRGLRRRVRLPGHGQVGL